MPARQDYRIRQVAGRAEVSERTARRWRDSGDERFNRYLENYQAPFQGLHVPPIQEPELEPFAKIANSDQNGAWIEPKTFTRAEAIMALDEMMCYTERMVMLLAKDPVIFEGIVDADWMALHRCGKVMERLAIRFNGGSLAHRNTKE